MENQTSETSSAQPNTGSAVPPAAAYSPGAPPPYAYYPPPRKSTLGFWIVILFLIGALGLSILINIGLASSNIAKGFEVTHENNSKHGVDEFPHFNEIWSYGDGETKVVRIEVEGLIMHEQQGGLFTQPEDKIESILEQIRAASHDDEVEGIIVEVDSPGGGVTPSDEIYMALEDFKATRESRKVVIFMRDLAASGGYYVACAGDYLISEPTSIIGSIGVIMQSINMKGLSEKIGITDVTIKSGKNKDLMNPFRDSDPEQLALLQKMVDQMYQRFAGIVQKSRNLDDATIKVWADGRVFTPDEALGAGFIDGIGYWDDAVAATAKVLGKENVKVIRYERHVDFWGALLSARLNVEVPLQLNSEGPQFMYLWRP